MFLVKIITFCFIITASLAITPIFSAKDEVNPNKAIIKVDNDITTIAYRGHGGYNRGFNSSHHHGYRTFPRHYYSAGYNFNAYSYYSYPRNFSYYYYPQNYSYYSYPQNRFSSSSFIHNNDNNFEYCAFCKWY